MLTPRLITIFGISIPVFALHGMEEFATHFYDVDAQSQAIFGIFNSMSNHGATFLVFQLMLWLLLTVSFLLLLGKSVQFYLLGIVGLVYLYEMHHVYKAVTLASYYPGLITSLAFPVIAYFFWKEWMSVYKKSSRLKNIEL